MSDFDRSEVTDTNESKPGQQEVSGRDKHPINGLFIDRESIVFTAVGAFGAIALIGLGIISNKLKPAAVTIAKEGFTFKEWVASKLDTAMEDVEDIVAEAKHSYYKDLKLTQETLKKEKDILETVQHQINVKMEKKCQSRKEKGEVH